MNLHQLLRHIFVGGDKLSIQKISRGFEISFGHMYGRPELSLIMLESLGKLFGTKKIDVDNYSHSGCESCDYGSDYGHTIQILDPTENIGQAEGLCNKKLLDKGLPIEWDKHFTEEEEWLDKLEQNETDVELRYVFSDWLEDRGRIEEAKMCRIEADIINSRIRSGYC